MARLERTGNAGAEALALLIHLVLVDHLVPAQPVAYLVVALVDRVI
ncbi:MAG: hypothetical protein BWY71_00110 [Planctomycetes bacterium ADurb.Bin412]|nr:MAG: hypothetical protein BWY71_00110 [Planctomycetes bacterium ADurb.Bin412]